MCVSKWCLHHSSSKLSLWYHELLVIWHSGCACRNSGGHQTQIWKGKEIPLQKSRPKWWQGKRTDGRTDRRTEGQGDTSIPPYQLRWSGGIVMITPSCSFVQVTAAEFLWFFFMTLIVLKLLTTDMPLLACYLIRPWEISIQFHVGNFQANFRKWWLRYPLLNCPQMNATKPYWW